MIATPRRFGAYNGETGVGGLLLLFVLTQLLSGVLLGYQLPRTWAGFSGPTWALGADSSWFRPTLVYEAAMQVVRLAGIAIGLVMIVRGSSRTPAFYRAFLATVLLLSIVDALLIARVYAQLHVTLRALGASTTGLGASRYVALTGDARTAAYALIWWLYWRQSERVRRTFAPAR
ncbi:MAG: DUF2569 family protein [Gemmatimonadaceae bacterium]|nr:DUF2569 family protein [Gemmatimonadaceae bacterium]